MIIRCENKTLVIFYKKHFSETVNKHKIEGKTLAVIKMKNCPIQT